MIAYRPQPYLGQEVRLGAESAKVSANVFEVLAKTLKIPQSANHHLAVDPSDNQRRWH